MPLSMSRTQCIPKMGGLQCSPIRMEQDGICGFRQRQFANSSRYRMSLAAFPPYGGRYFPET
jgi:hypothetical protein